MTTSIWSVRLVSCSKTTVLTTGIYDPRFSDEHESNESPRQ